MDLAEEAGLNHMAYRQALQDAPAAQATLAAHSAFSRCAALGLYLAASQWRDAQLHIYSSSAQTQLMTSLSLLPCLTVQQDLEVCG